MATWDNKAPLPIMQVMRDAIHMAKYPASTPFSNGDHVLCVSDTLSINLSLPIIDPTGLTAGLPLGNWNLAGSLKNGGICLFPQYLKTQPITLGQIRPLVDKLLEHGCGTCGSVPVHFVDQGSNDPGEGILTFNYVRQPYCTENCLTDGLVEGSNVTTTAAPASPAAPVAGAPPAGASAAAVDAQGKYRNGTAAAGEAAVGGDPVRGRAEGKMLVKRSVAVDDEASLSSSEEDEDEREASGEEDEQGRGRLSTQSAKFAELKPRWGGGRKGWVGWLRRL